MTMSCDDADISGVRRFEVFTGVGKCRDWPREVKALVVGESYSGKEMEERGIALPVRSREAPMFVPAVVEKQEPLPPAVSSKPASRRRSSRASAIELDIGEALVRIGSGADADTIAAVITALRASR